jgi:hypothetical protein
VVPIIVYFSEKRRSPLNDLVLLNSRPARTFALLVLAANAAKYVGGSIPISPTTQSSGIELRLTSVHLPHETRAF